MTANHILGILGSLITFAALFELMRRRRLREKYAVLWVTVSVGLVLIALVPALLPALADLVGVEVPTNLLFFVASVVLMLVSMQHSYELGRLEEETRTLAEEVALLRLDLDERGSQSRPQPD
ncbi:DUF2304 domain-containing protein [Nocardioides sp. YIM 152315]|uniref:DUF2304 domain-containing protein n=1 Tax=Nocardioides sp. YIM 152315 TaxID=3031760 RepID=UPI0023DAB243|nr:DUF2304 domain-containing protein [Nocardioides sp. YIM 152315]MDF1602826.1 DUF2304 domain-containing protein [Nocardioides sp. YIM 152315]